MDTSGAGKVLRASTVHTPSEDTANEVAPAVQRILETDDDSGDKTCRDADKDQYLCAQSKRESHRYHSVRARPRRAGNRNRPFSALPGRVIGRPGNEPCEATAEQLLVRGASGCSHNSNTSGSGHGACQGGPRP